MDIKIMDRLSTTTVPSLIFDCFRYVCIDDIQSVAEAFLKTFSTFDQNELHWAVISDKMNQ